MVEQISEYDSDQASIALGNLWGLAHMCFGQVSEPPPKESAIDFLHVRAALRYIAFQVKNVQSASSKAPTEVRQALDAARGVCEVIAADAAVEYVGREISSGMHWNDEITSWAFGALCDALEVAKKAVDDGSLTEIQSGHEANHVQH